MFCVLMDALSGFQQTSGHLRPILFRPADRHREHHAECDRYFQMHLRKSSDRVMLKAVRGIKTAEYPLYRCPLVIESLPLVA